MTELYSQVDLLFGIGHIAGVDVRKLVNEAGEGSSRWFSSLVLEDLATRDGTHDHVMTLEQKAQAAIFAERMVAELTPRGITVDLGILGQEPNNSR